MKYTFIFLLFFSFVVYAETLITPSYKIVIGSCPEGYVTCDNIPFEITDLKTGDISSHAGRTLHTLCADGVTPCRFLGYQFSGDTGKFYIYDNGALEIKGKSGQVILFEEGMWSE
jgi:hypothetical protein